MRKEDILKDPKLLKRFCKDANLPINIYENPYFIERLEAIDPIFSSINKFELFAKELRSFNNAQDYFEYYNSLKDIIIFDIKNNPYFEAFNTGSFSWQNLKYQYSNKDFYKMPLNGQSIISIDMKKANFSALSVFDKRIFGNAESWEEFIGRYTCYKHIVNSKYIRQVVMGTCNPKRQVAYEKYLMGTLLEYLKREMDIHVFSFSSDEIIIIPDSSDVISFYNTISERVNNWEHSDIVRISVFTLTKLPVTDGWKREIFNGETTEIDFKKMPAEYYHMAVKHEFGIPITEDDLTFYHDGKLARFLEPVF